MSAPPSTAARAVAVISATLGESYLKEPFVITDGYINVPIAPGLGIEVDEEALAGKLYNGNWQSPRLWHEDGSLADW